MAANNCKHTEWILETIDHLRRRKARPDVERICHVVRRRYGLSAAETEAKLEKLVDAEIVIKVDYKGSTSYRNAAKWRKSMLGCAVMNSTTISKKILEAILELSKVAVARNRTSGGSDGSSSLVSILPTHQLPLGREMTETAIAVGFPLEAINAWLSQNCDGYGQLKSPLTVILKREIDAGRIRRLGSTNYVISPEQMREISEGEIRPLQSNRKQETKPVGLATPTPHQPASGNATVVSSSNSNNNNNKDSLNNNIPRATPPKLVNVDGMGRSTVSSNVNSKHSQGQGQQLTLQQGPQVLAQPQPARRGRPPKHRPPTVVPPTALLPAGAASGASTGTEGTPSKLKRMLSSGPEVPISGSPERKQAKRSLSQGQGEHLCDFCHQSSFRNKVGEPELLLSCKDCTARAHPTCMKYPPLLASRAYKGPWQCMDCKTCCVCHDAGDPDLLLFCDGCDKGYHTSCHQPEVTKKPSGLWQCSSCKLENVAMQRTEFQNSYGGHHLYSTNSAPPTPAESPVSMTNGHPIPTSPVYSPDGLYPDASGWSVEDVVDFVSSAGFSEEAKVFREQEIDGVALLLLKRGDVLKGLELKLGPALKINRHIQGLQAAKEVSLL